MGWVGFGTLHWLGGRRSVIHVKRVVRQHKRFYGKHNPKNDIGQRAQKPNSHVAGKKDAADESYSYPSLIDAEIRTQTGANTCHCTFMRYALEFFFHGLSFFNCYRILVLSRFPPHWHLYSSVDR